MKSKIRDLSTGADSFLQTADSSSSSQSTSSPDIINFNSKLYALLWKGKIFGKNIFLNKYIPIGIQIF